MTDYPGRLLDGIAAYQHDWPSRKFGLLVIDEQGRPRRKGNRATAMLQTINFADQRGFKIVLVEINTGMAWESRLPTRANFIPQITNHTVFFKNGFNAFGVIDQTGVPKYALTSYSSSLLDAELRNAGVGELIVLGREASCCVRLTVTGGQEVPVPQVPELTGALGYGYQVWTTPDIIEGNASGWTGQRGIRCYATV